MMAAVVRNRAHSQGLFQLYLSFFTETGPSPRCGPDRRRRSGTVVSYAAFHRMQLVAAVIDEPHKICKYNYEIDQQSHIPARLTDTRFRVFQFVILVSAIAWPVTMVTVKQLSCHQLYETLLNYPPFVGTTKLTLVLMPTWCPLGWGTIVDHQQQ